MSAEGIRLLATDEEDLKILSVHLQDAVARLGDFVYQAKRRRFVALFNRFRWEDAGRTRQAPGMRVRSGLHFDDVLSVKSQNVRRGDPDAVVELLALRFVPGEDGAGVVEFVLAGGGVIRLEVECIDAQLRDVSKPWPAVARPAHDTART